MSKNVVKASQKAQGEQADASVFDFLYHDSRRVGSFLSQLDQNGLLTEIRQSEHATKGARRGFSANLGASTPITGGGNIGIEVTPKEGGGEALERVYDPFWANARELLDVLEAHGMIQRELGEAPLGSLVLVSGPMNVIDLGFMKNLWSMPSIKKAIKEGANQAAEPEPELPLNRHSRRTHAKQKRAAAQPQNNETEMLLDVLPALPHALLVTVRSESGMVLARMREEHFVGEGSDLVLKHGIAIPGNWHMLGILDAQPDLGGMGDLADNAVTDIGNPMNLFFNSMLGQMAVVVAPVIRIMVGRPANAYGITPLMVFRQVS